MGCAGNRHPSRAIEQLLHHASALLTEEIVGRFDAQLEHGECHGRHGGADRDLRQRSKPWRAEGRDQHDERKERQSLILGPRGKAGGRTGNQEKRPRLGRAQTHRDKCEGGWRISVQPETRSLGARLSVSSWLSRSPRGQIETPLSAQAQGCCWWSS